MGCLLETTIKADYLKKNGKHYVLVSGPQLSFPSSVNTVDANSYTVPFNLVNLAILHKHGATFTDELIQKKLAIQEKVSYAEELPSFLMPFQKEGCSKMIAKKRGTLLADEQGLGKSIQLLTYLNVRSELRPCVIVCPAHLKWNWKNEFDKWYPNLRVQVLKGETPYDTYADIVIINYEIVPYWVDKLNEKGVKLVICDEAHRIKNTNTKAYNAVIGLGDKPVRMMASGTPLVNNPENVWALVDAISPYILGGYTGFINYFCVTKKRPLFRGGKPIKKFGHQIYVKQIVAAQNLDVLNKVLTSSVMIRRTKAEVLPQLPSKTKTVIPVELSLNKNLMDQAEELILSSEGEELEKAYALVYKEIGLQKIDIAKQWIKDYLESCTGSLVVMGWHREVTTSLYEAFKDDAVLIIGGSTDKEQSVKLFMEGKKRLLIGNIKAAGTGLTLTVASDMLFVELPMTAADLDQASDRIHRIGQTEHVNYYFLVAKDTMEEEKIVKMLDAKADMSAKAIDGKVEVTYCIGDLLKDAVKQMKG